MNTQGQTDPIKKNFDPKNIIFNFDEEEESQDFDEINFKPINAGLGFHHEDKNLKKIIKAPTTSRAQTKPIQQATVTPTTFTTRLSTKMEEVALPELHHRVEKVAEPKKEESLVQKFQLADPWEKSLAYIVDMIILTGIIGLTAYSGFHFSGLDIRQLNFNSPQVLGSLVGIFALVYIFFFSVLDISETPGKSMFNLGVIRTNDEKCRLTDVFIRSFVSFISFTLCILPLALGFHDKLSGTVVIKRS